MKAKQRILALVSAFTLLFFTLVAQISSDLTPFLSRYPVLFSVMASLGVYLLLIAISFAGIMYFQSRKPIFLYMITVFMLELLYISFTLWGEVFQLGITGLTLATSLLLLALKPRLFIFNS